MSKRPEGQQRARKLVRIKRAYVLFQRGDHLTDSQIRLLLKAIDDAECLLAIPAFEIARRSAALDHLSLTTKLQARGEKSDDRKRNDVGARRAAGHS